MIQQTAGAEVSVLVDTCVRSDAEVAQPISVEIPGYQNHLVLLQARKENKSSWHREQIECIPTIARLAREGRLSLFIHDALREEIWRKPGSYPYTGFGDLFHGLNLQRVQAAVNRHVFFQSDITKAIGSKDQLVDFCKWLLNGYDDRWLEAPHAKQALSANDIANLKNVSRYREICSKLSQKHYDDAFHLWGGEANGIGYFLTTNIKFVRGLRQNKNLKLICKPIWPSELLQSLPAVDPEPMPFEYERRYLLNGRPYD